MNVRTDSELSSQDSGLLAPIRFKDLLWMLIVAEALLVIVGTGLSLKDSNDRRAQVRFAEEVRQAQRAWAHDHIDFATSLTQLGIRSDRWDVQMVAVPLGGEPDFLAQVCDPSRCVAISATGHARIFELP